MAEILKFGYVLLLFLSLFLVMMEVGGEYNECETNVDCPQSSNVFYVFMCVDHICELVRN
ncbi:unnamed protein product [Trifolium pratense]|uniref:Uncharacterized protein n=1 Tax=Trifolium pratense TaxID=57577 RepID=A0ACB0KA09_TRIPR|nr:unnamed protein product [Trifolium pratense]